MINIKHRIYWKYCNNLELTVFLFEEIKDWKELSEKKEKFSKIIYVLIVSIFVLVSQALEIKLLSSEDLILGFIITKSKLSLQVQLNPKWAIHRKNLSNVALTIFQ